MGLFGFFGWVFLSGFFNANPDPSGEEGGNFLVQLISTCLPSRRGEGGGRHPVVQIGKYAVLWIHIGFNAFTNPGF